MADITFYHPQFFWLLAIVPLWAAWYIWVELKAQPKLALSTFETLQKVATTRWRIWFKHFIFLLELIAFSLMTVALARPQSALSWQNVTAEGIDIVISLDISGSMLAEDLKPNRLEASKNVAIDFIKARPNDRVGLVIYSGESFTQCPITTDHDVLINLFQSITNGMIEDGTAIGNGLATAVSRLKESEAKSKVVILLTDGVYNAGQVPPLTAAELAKTFGIRVYTIGVGANGVAPYPFRNLFGGISYQNVEVKIDEELLKEIATMTDGKYFRATDNESLQAVYQEIDAMEKSKISVTEFRKKNEEFEVWLLSALGLLVVTFLSKKLILKGII